MRKNSYFIVFEGMEGSGKSSLMLMAARLLFEERFDPILLTTEPTPRMKKIHRSSADANPESNARKCLKLFVEDRKKNLKLDIIPILGNEHALVLCERYKYSTYAYQHAQGINFSEIEALHKGLPVPDLVLIIDVPVKSAYDRINRDLKGGKKFSEIAIKFSKYEFLKKVRENFLGLKKHLPKENIVVIDGDRPKDEVFRVVQREIMKVIGDK